MLRWIPKRSWGPRWIDERVRDFESFWLTDREVCCRGVKSSKGSENIY